MLSRAFPNRDVLLGVAWATSVLSMAGSLFFSEVMRLPPCVLCWYQRIFMFSIVFVGGMALIRRQEGLLAPYMGLLSGVGWLISGYHNLLYYGWLKESLSPCVQGISCTTKQLEVFGFVTIPLMAFVAFSLIVICVWMGRSNHEN